MATPVTMLKSAAYARLRAENATEFVPRSIFFAYERGSEINRRNSLWVKAALVYESITGRHVSDKAKPVATRLLLTLANTCRSLIDPPDPPQTTAHKTYPSTSLAEKSASAVPAASSNVPGKAVEDQGEKQMTEFDDDEGSDENKRVIDAIFLVVGFLPRLLTTPRKGDVVTRDAVDEGFKSTHMQDIVTDVIKLENQLPLEHLLAVVDHVEDAIHDAGGAVGFDGLEDCLKGYKLGFNRRTFHEQVVRSFCWYYSPFFSKQVYSPFSSKHAAPPQDGKLKDVADKGAAKMDCLHAQAPTKAPPQDGKLKDVADKGAAKMEARTLLDCLHASVVPSCAAEKDGAGGSESGGKTSHMPTARELSRSGVRLAPGDDGRAVVEFNEQSSRLRLPALVFDFKLATVARNLLALEYKEQSKPVTRYFQMMNELVEEVADAKILRRAGVVRAGGSGGAHEVHELIKKIDGYATYPSVFMAMDVQIEKVKQFHDKRMQNFFVRYRPGVIWASSVAAVSVVAIVVARRNRG